MPKVLNSLSTGLPGLDEVIRDKAGDNIVWQVESIEDYIPFTEYFKGNHKNR